MEDNKLITSPLEAIKQNCFDCAGGQRKEVQLCPVLTCALYPFRFGKNPYRTRNMTEQQKIELSERLAAARAVKDQKRIDDKAE